MLPVVQQTILLSASGAQLSKKIVHKKVRQGCYISISKDLKATSQFLESRQMLISRAYFAPSLY